MPTEAVDQVEGLAGGQVLEAGRDLGPALEPPQVVAGVDVDPGRLARVPSSPTWSAGPPSPAGRARPARPGGCCPASGRRGRWYPEGMGWTETRSIGWPSRPNSCVAAGSRPVAGFGSTGRWALTDQRVRPSTVASGIRALAELVAASVAAGMSRRGLAVRVAARASVASRTPMTVTAATANQTRRPRRRPPGVRPRGPMGTT